MKLNFKTLNTFDMKQIIKYLRQFKQWILFIVIDSTPVELPKNKNPYILIWYKQSWSKRKTAENNTKYWQWEIDYNGFTP